MSINLETPETALGMVDAAGNYVAQIRLALMVGDKPRAMHALEKAERLVFDAVQSISKLDADLYERQQWLNNAERILRDLGYERCTAAACNCSSYHKTTKDMKTNIAELLKTVRADYVATLHDNHGLKRRVEPFKFADYPIVAKLDAAILEYEGNCSYHPVKETKP